jgi:hypothetical protein
MICGVALSVAGCATASKDLTATYVSPMQYGTYDCDQLNAEAQRIQARVVQLGGRLDQAAQNDAGIMAVGMILFWPALFALGGTKQQEAEYSRLKGEYDAVMQAAIQKRCPTMMPNTQTATASSAMPAPNNAATPTAPLPPVQSVAVVASNPAPANGSQPAAAAIPQANGTLSVTTATSASVSKSKYLYNAERFAKDGGCENASATVNIASPAYETFTVVCAKGDPISVRCDATACREMK